MKLNGIFAVAAIVTLAATVTADDDEKPATAVPSKSAEEAVKRFVTECVEITPGKGGFPATAVIGAEAPAAFEVARREVTLTEPFRISRYEVTQELYAAVVGNNPSRWKGPRNSVEGVTWTEAEQFCGKLTKILRERKLIALDEVVRLPTAVEWEYCCRAGTTTAYSFGKNDPGRNGGTELLDEYGWHTGNAAGNDPAVGILKPNPWGLYDVHGYLWEYVSDSVGAEDSGERLIRGGSWRDPVARLSSSAYLTVPDHVSSDAIGLRCVIGKNPAAKNASGR